MAGDRQLSVSLSEKDPSKRHESHEEEGEQACEEEGENDTTTCLLATASAKDRLITWWGGYKGGFMGMHTLTVDDGDPKGPDYPDSLRIQAIWLMMAQPSHES